MSDESTDDIYNIKEGETIQKVYWQDIYFWKRGVSSGLRNFLENGFLLERSYKRLLPKNGLFTKEAIEASTAEKLKKLREKIAPLHSDFGELLRDSKEFSTCIKCMHASLQKTMTLLEKKEQEKRAGSSIK